MFIIMWRINYIAFGMLCIVTPVYPLEIICWYWLFSQMNGLKFCKKKTYMLMHKWFIMQTTI